MVGIFHDNTHPSIVINLETCIACNHCERICVDASSSDVIETGERTIPTLPSFDVDDPMGLSTYVVNGECVHACPTGALMEHSVMSTPATHPALTAKRIVYVVCPFCRVGCQTRVHLNGEKTIKVDGRDGPALHNRRCVRRRFGSDHVMSPQRLTMPLVRRDDASKHGDMHLLP